MENSSSLINILYFLNSVAIGIAGLITGYLVVLALLALFGILPANRDVTFELPVKLNNIQSNYPVTSHSTQYSSTHIEAKDVELEILPTKRTYPQFFAHLMAASFVGFYLAILLFLGRIINTIRNGTPFQKRNVASIRWIGILTISIAVYEFLIGWIITSIFSSKFSVENAEILSTASIWDINFITIFLGLVFLVVAEVFRYGKQLQDLEDQTV